MLKQSKRFWVLVILTPIILMNLHFALEFSPYYEMPCLTKSCFIERAQKCMAVSLVSNDDYGNNDGTVNGAASVPGKVSSALSFDGSNDYIGAGPLGQLDDFTISTWIYPDDIGDNETILSLNTFVGGAASAILLRIAPSSVYWQVNDTGRRAIYGSFNPGLTGMEGEYAADVFAKSKGYAKWIVSSLKKGVKNKWIGFDKSECDLRIKNLFDNNN